MNRIFGPIRTDSIPQRAACRGPFVRGWIIDLAPRAFKKLGGLGEGVIPVKIYHLKKR